MEQISPLLTSGLISVILLENVSENPTNAYTMWEQYPPGISSSVYRPAPGLQMAQLLKKQTVRALSSGWVIAGKIYRVTEWYKFTIQKLPCTPPNKLITSKMLPQSTFMMLPQGRKLNWSLTAGGELSITFCVNPMRSDQSERENVLHRKKINS